MFHKFISKFFVVATALSIATVSVLAQSAPVRGRVELKKADGTVVPVAAASVDVYRTDVKGKLPSAKTDKKGYFSFAGFPLGQTFALAISGVGISPYVYPNVKAGMENLTIEVSEGDGSKMTEEQVRQTLAQISSQTGGQVRELTAEEKKAQAELDAKNKEILAKNEKAKNVNEITAKAMEEGTKAFAAKNLDLAIAKFEEGYQADAEFAGTAPVFLNNKALVLKERGFATYKKSTGDPANKASYLASAKDDFSAAVEATDRAIAILKANTSTDPAIQKGYASNMYLAYTTQTECYRLLVMTRADTSKANEAYTSFTSYIAIEPDPAKKSKAQLTLADVLRESGDCQRASEEYRKVVAESPDSPDGLAGLGLCLFSNGAAVGDKVQMQEGLNVMQRFTEVAPEGHPLKQSVKESVDYLRTQEKLTPQKVARPPAKKRN